MFDPKLAGEEADQMIHGMNPQPAEDQPGEQADAIVQDVEQASIDDQGTKPATVERDVNEEISAKLEQMSKQVEAAEQRWRVLQGMIDKKDSEIESMRTLLAQLADKPEEAASATQEQNSGLVTEKDSEAYGEDLIDLIKRGSLSVARAEIGKLEQRLAKLEGSVQGVQQVTAKTAEEKFFDKLASRVPDWEATNVDPGFIGWLNETDPFTGATKLELLQHAVSSQDVTRASTFFLEYQKVNGVESEQEAPAKSKVAQLVSPGKSKSPTPRADGTNKRTWSGPEIAKLYDDKMAGRISQKEFDELERDIFAAQRTGRIAA
jgi:hypothetical protein